MNTATYPSAEVVAAVARERQVTVLQQVAALDTKAAALIGFSGVILGLLFSSDLATDHWNCVLTAGTVLLGLSVLLLAYAVIPRRYRFNPNIALLHRRYINRPPDETHWVVAASIGRAIAADQIILRRKAFAVRAATLIIVLALMIIGTRLVYLLS